MSVSDEAFLLPLAGRHTGLIDYFRTRTTERLGNRSVPVRFLVTGFDDSGYRCEVGVANRSLWCAEEKPSSIFSFTKRRTEDTRTFNVAFVVPTGIGAEIGGHAGDSTPAARLLATCCDMLIIHPNVVNASDINEAPENSLYVEGSTITRLIMGVVGLQQVRTNRVLVVIDGSHNETFLNATINSVNAARSCYGLVCAGIWRMDSPFRMKSGISTGGRATGRVDSLESLVELLRNHRDEFDAVSLSSPISTPDGTVQQYFSRDGEMINPWGGVEALLTHTLGIILDLPAAHSPMMESHEIASVDLGVVDPRLAAESVSMTFVNCVLKGLQKSPRLITDQEAFVRPEVFTVSNLSCLVIPFGCLGLPTLAALEQGIRVIAVKENSNLMRNDLGQLPWKPGQYMVAANYLEAAGFLNALRAGLDPESVRRPLARTKVDRIGNR